MLYPILTSSRSVLDLSGIWAFKEDDESGFENKWYQRPLEGSRTMPVPASYNDITQDESLRDHYGWVFYQREIEIPDYLREQRIVLRMGAVTHAAKVYLNGAEICTHKGGFLPFEAEIHSRLREGRNLLTIAVDNRIDLSTLPVGSESGGGMGMLGFGAGDNSGKENIPNFDFFNYSGLTRPVKIYTTPRAYIRDITVVPEVKGATGILHYDVDIADMNDAASTFDIKDMNDAASTFDTKDMNDAASTFDIKDMNDAAGAADIAEMCGAVKGPGTIGADQAPNAGRSSEVIVRIFDRQRKLVAQAVGRSGKIEIEDAALWYPLNPYLYEIEVVYGSDTYTLPYGIRTVAVQDGRFLINGKSFYFKGYGKHEDTFPSGRGVNLPMNSKDISLMKWQGANSFRTSHYPYSEEMMRLCDQEGIVVIDEVPAVGLHLNFGGGAHFKDGKRVETFAPESEGGIRTAAHHREVIRDLICRDKNHACVVMWSIANEADSGGPGAYEYFKPLFDLAKELDPQKRPCTIVSVQMPNFKEDCTIRLSDVYCLNRYYGWYGAGGRLEAAKRMCREELSFWNSLGKPFMYTEYGADTVAGMHDSMPVMFTEEYQVDYYKANHEVVDTMQNFIGEQVWNFADFATSQSLMRVQGNKKGIFTRDRKPKLAAHYLRQRWQEIPDFDYK